MDQLGTSILLNDAAGRISGSGANNRIHNVTTSRALVGTLTVHGIVNTDGSPYGDWVIDAGTNGAVFPPASGSDGCGGLWYTLGNPAADSGAAVVAYHRVP